MILMHNFIGCILANTRSKSRYNKPFNKKEEETFHERNDEAL